ncbi:MAG: hypothetical protein EBV06_18030, partial [Planctomycetia bacterium]|nr:hypothetical protein [Planctomycetia bacterium]
VIVRAAHKSGPAAARRALDDKTSGKQSTAHRAFLSPHSLEAPALQPAIFTPLEAGQGSNSLVTFRERLQRRDIEKVLLASGASQLDSPFAGQRQAGTTMMRGCHGRRWSFLVNLHKSVHGIPTPIRA